MEVHRRFQITLVVSVLIAAVLFAVPGINGPATASPSNPNLASTNPHPAWSLYQTDPDMLLRGMAAVYDAHRQVVVVFGGFDSQDTVTNGTYEFDGTSWQKVTPLHSPPARAWLGVAYDSNRQVVVLYGGSGEQGGLGDTWEYNGTDWTQVVTPHAPPVWVGFGMTYDSCRQKVVLFGGSDPFKGTWEYDGADWKEIAVSIDPGSLWLTAMTFDPVRCLSVLFGGDAGNSTGTDQSWEYDGVNWTLVTTPTSPIPRWAHALAYDPRRGKIVLFGGFGPQYPTGTALSDTWEYDGANWIETSPSLSPPSREQHVLVYEGNSQKILLFGGWGYADTWFYGDEYTVSLPLIIFDPGNPERNINLSVLRK
jgi:hypothetical protein